MSDELKIFSGSANVPLYEKICDYLSIAPGQITVERFPDGECFCRIEEDVRGRDVFIVQPTCRPVNDNLMELLIMIECFKRASAGRITSATTCARLARKSSVSARAFGGSSDSSRTSARIFSANAVPPDDETGLYDKLVDESKDLFRQSITYLVKSVEFLDNLPEEQKPYHRANLAGALNALGTAYARVEMYDESKAAHKRVQDLSAE